MRPPRTDSVMTLARIIIRPRPVSYMLRIPAVPTMKPPVGKSGPGSTSMSSSVPQAGLATSTRRAAATSARLCGGTLVLIPTAMPELPFTSRFGKRAGRTVGSFSRSSKLFSQATVSLSISASSSVAAAERRASVYRYAAAESPSIEPKLPCPSTSGQRSEKSWTMRTRAS